MKIFDILMGRKKVRDAYMGGSRFVSRWAKPPSMNTANWLGMYSKSPRLAVVEKIATDLAGLNGHLLRINPDGTETELTMHPFLDFMAHPNPLFEMTSSAIWRLNEIYLMLVGESFFLIERDDSGRPIEMWNVPPHWVKMTPYIGNPGYMITSPGGLVMNVPVDDMFVMKHLNPLDPFMRGLGVAESIADEIEIDEFSAQFQKRFFYNDGTPSMVFLMPDASDAQRDAFMARWNKKYRGVENSHKAAALTGNVDIKTFGSKDVRELGFVDSRVAIRDAVLEHFGVPREIMGITENSNRSTADSAQYIYAKNVLTPRIRDREEAINQQLLPLFGEDLVWRFDPVIPYDKEFDNTRALDGWKAGLLTMNEARGLMDFPSVQGGDTFKIGINDLFMEQTADPVEISRALGESYGEKADRRVNIEAMLRKEDAALRENERRFEAAVIKYFAGQQTAAAKALGLTAKAEIDALAALDDLLLPDGTFDPMLWDALKEQERQKLADAAAAGLLNWKDETKKLVAILTPLWKQAYDDGAKGSAESYGLADLVRPEFVSQARVNGGKRVVGIQAATQKKIADIIARGVENGSSQNELKKEVLTAMGPGTARARAKLIARQETMMSLATGQFDTMKAAGAATKKWHHRDLQKDPRDGTRGKANHVILDGETVDIDKPFSNGLMYPRDPEDGRPEELINCRCYLTYGGF